MWRLLTNRRVLQAAAVMGVLLVVALWPEATEVEVGSVTRGALAVTIDEQGETRVHHRFIVSAPVAGVIERIELEPGNGVEVGRPSSRGCTRMPPHRSMRASGWRRPRPWRPAGPPCRASAEEQRAARRLATWPRPS